jgi:hypothetical protein
MSLSLADIEGEAGRLIEFLIASLEPIDEGDIEAAWSEEVLARSREIQEDRVTPVPAGEALARVRGNLR